MGHSLLRSFSVRMRLPNSNPISVHLMAGDTALLFFKNRGPHSKCPRLSTPKVNNGSRKERASLSLQQARERPEISSAWHS